MNSRYLAYCRAHGRTPEEMRAYDAMRYPGGPNTGYMTWLPSMWAEYRGSVGLAERAPLSDAIQADFDAWLETHAVAP